MVEPLSTSRIDLEIGDEPLPFYDALAKHGARTALIDETGAELSYSSLDRAVDSFVREHGLGGQLVFLECTNSVEAIVAYLACLRSHSPVFLYHAQDRGLLDQLLTIYDPNLIISWRNRAPYLLRRHGFAITMHPELRVLLSTSGSTGSPKLVKLSETNITSNARAIVDYLEMSPADRSITTLKLNYSYGMSVVNSALACGASLLLTERTIVDPKFWDVARRFEATNFAGVPYTYEMLSRMSRQLSEWTSLRFATQAGGRMAPEAVASFARISREAGWRFYVMYGQTEAAPRMAYLPPEKAELYPSSVGRAVPGGTIEILDQQGLPITIPGVVGELRYRGPNVMMGYARHQDELAEMAGTDGLETGDQAVWNEAGLVEIVGRTSRFVKPFGLRVNLDEIERYVRASLPEAVCTGTDTTIFIAVPAGEHSSQEGLTARLAERYHLPEQLFQIIEVEHVPRLSNGKVDYQAILRRCRDEELRKADHAGVAARPRSRNVEIILSRNQVVTLLVSGLWHGAAWTFISWGFLHGLLLVLQRQIGSRIKALYAHSRTATRLSVPIQIAMVFVAVAFTRIFFRSPDMATAGLIIGKIFQGPYNWKGIDSKADVAFCLSAVVALTLVEGLAERGFWRRLFRRRRILRCAAVLMIFVITLLVGEFQGGRFVYVAF
jgi:acyl-coenzyme A synthetase/AMP-(fatty) acid ligase